MRKGKKMVTVLSYVILAAGLLWVSLPFVWMVKDEHYEKNISSSVR